MTECRTSALKEVALARSRLTRVAGGRDDAGLWKAALRGHETVVSQSPLKEALDNLPKTIYHTDIKTRSQALKEATRPQVSVSIAIMSVMWFGRRRFCSGLPS